MKRAILAVFLIAFCAAGAANAQTLDPSQIKKVPRFKTLSDADFIAKTNLHKAKPEGDKYLAFNIRIPKDWQRAPGAKLQSNTGKDANRAGLLGKVAKYFAPPDLQPKSYMEVEAMALDYDISAHNWFLNYVLANGFTLQGMEDIDDSRLEALYVLVQKDQSYIVRSIAQINGSRMVLASYYMPEYLWNEEKELQEKVIDSFQFTSPERIRVELTHTYDFLDLLHFDYPISWRLLAPNINSTEGMDIRLINSKDNRTIIGEIGIHLKSIDMDTTLADEVQSLRDNLKQSDLEIGRLIEVAPSYHVGKQVYFSKTEVYEARSKESRLMSQEFWLAIMVEDRYYYIVTLLTPSRNDNFLNWARNTEAFRLLLESFRT